MVDLEREFQSPSSGFRGVPFWAWNGKLEKDTLQEQVSVFQKMGFGGFHIHVRTGLDDQYLGTEYMEAVSTVVEKAKECELKAWLYDEDRWASGAAGGFVTKEQKYRQKYLLFTPFSYDEVGPSAPPRGFLFPHKRSCEGKLLARYEVILDKVGCLENYRRVQDGDKTEGQIWFAYLECARDNPWYNGQAYVDTLMPEAIERFLEITHQSYKEKVGAYFGETIPGFFTDEPQFAKKNTFAYPESMTDITMPWTEDLEKFFYNAYGFSILDRLPELFWNLPDKQYSEARYAYHDCVAELFSKAYFQTYRKWCEKNKVKFTGHLMEEPTLQSQCSAVGETMRCYPYLDVPGVDMLRKDMELTTVKQAQSSSRQYGREGVMSELYGVTGWDFDFRDYKFYGDWQAALGVTLRVPHLSWMSMEGEAKRDFPASIFYQSPWYQEFPYVEDHFARTGWAMSKGDAVVRVGVIHPIESCWLLWGPESQDGTAREQLDKNFLNLTEWLLTGSIDFDFICESTLEKQCRQGGFPLQVGKMAYEAILIPGCITLRKTTVERLEWFQKDGGKLIFLGSVPQCINGKPSEILSGLFEKSKVLDFQKNVILDALSDLREIQIFDADGKRSDKYLYQLRKEKKRSWLFIAHSKRPYNKDISRYDEICVRIRGTGSVKVWDTLTGTQKKIYSKVRNGWTEFKRRIYDYDSLLISLEEETGEAVSIQESEGTGIPVTIPECVPYSLNEPNVLLLDRAEYALNEEPYQSAEEILRLDNLCRERLGMPVRGMAIMQPWADKKKIAEHCIWLRFTIESEVCLDKIFLGAERPEKKKIVWNGEIVKCDSAGWYVDKHIKKIPLCGLKKGKNVLEIKQPFGIGTNTEWFYLLGNFGVHIKGTEKKLLPIDEKISFGDIRESGLPFYGGALTYHVPLQLPRGKIKLRVPHYRGGLIRANLDGEQTKRIVLPPYMQFFSVSQKGQHFLNITVYPSRNNAFGPVHLADKCEEWLGPSAWRSYDDAWTDGYCLKEEGILSKPVITILPD